MKKYLIGILIFSVAFYLYSNYVAESSLSGQYVYSMTRPMDLALAESPPDNDTIILFKNHRFLSLHHVSGSYMVSKKGLSTKLYLRYIDGGKRRLIRLKVRRRLSGKINLVFSSDIGGAYREI